jgi:hypothetical protein
MAPATQSFAPIHVEEEGSKGRRVKEKREKNNDRKTPPTADRQ